jgi:D-lactate dehydrogenase
MRLCLFSVKPFEREPYAAAAAARGIELSVREEPLDAAHAGLAAGFPAVCAFVNDQVDRAALARLAAGGTRLVALRCAGSNQVDLAAARELGMAVANVPAYSPSAVAEHAVALLLTLNRKIHLAWQRVRGWDFSLDGLMGFDLNGKTVGVVGTGRIGAVFARIMTGFGCRVLASDPAAKDACVRLGVSYVPFAELLRESHVVSLHAPLTPATRHLIDAAALAAMRPGAILVNTSRGGLLDTEAAIAALKAGTLGGLAIDVYEREAGVFFEDWSRRMLQDDVLARLIAFPNALVTAHQGFFTREALDNIAGTTCDNVAAFARGGAPVHPVA